MTHWAQFVTRAHWRLTLQAYFIIVSFCRTDIAAYATNNLYKKNLKKKLDFDVIYNSGKAVQVSLICVSGLKIEFCEITSGGYT